MHENDRAFKCNHCDKAFKLNQELKVHIASVHEGKKPYECSICSKRFSRSKDRNIHISNVHEGKKSFKCDICLNDYFTKNQLNVHTRSIHENIKPFRLFLNQGYEHHFVPMGEYVMERGRPLDGTARTKQCHLTTLESDHQCRHARLALYPIEMSERAC